MEGRPLRGIAEAPPTQCVPRDDCQVLWQPLQLTQEQRGGGAALGKPGRAGGCQSLCSPWGCFPLFALPRWARLGGLCSGVGPRSWGHSAWGGGCGRELSSRGGGLPQAWAGSLGEGHRIHVALEPLFCTQRLAGPSSGTAGVLFCPEAQSSDNCPRHLGQNVSIGDGAGKWVALQVQPHRQGTICSMQGMKDRHKHCRPTRLNGLVHFPFSEACSGK